MNWLKKGPDLKLPSLPSFGRKRKDDGGGVAEPKDPGFLSDLYYDLRERRLLPLIGLVLVAILAVPFLLGDKEEVVPPPVDSGASADASSAEGSTLAVVEANPGLRDPDKRLKGRKPTDPFVQQFAPSEDVEGEGSESTSSSTSTSTSLSSEPEEPVEVEVENDEGESVRVRPAGSSGPVSPNGESDGSPSGRYFGFRPDVRFGLQGSDQLKTYKELENGVRLPTKKPVAISLGVSSDGKRVLFALTPEAILVKAEGVECIGGAQECTFLSLKAGQAATIFTPNPERTFRLAVDSINWVEVEPPNPEKASKSDSRPASLEISQSFSK